MDNTKKFDKFVMYLSFFVVLFIVGVGLFALLPTPVYADSSSFTFSVRNNYSEALTCHINFGGTDVNLGTLYVSQTKSFTYSVSSPCEIYGFDSSSNYHLTQLSLDNSSFSRYSSSSPLVVSPGDIIYVRISTNNYNSRSSSNSYITFSSSTPTPSPTPTPTPVPTPFETPVGYQDSYSLSSYSPMRVTFSDDNSTPDLITYTVRSLDTLYTSTEFSGPYWSYKPQSALANPVYTNYQTLDFDIPFAFYGWGGSYNSNQGTMFISFALGLSDMYTFESYSGVMYLMNDLDQPIASIPLLKADFLNVFYCRNFSVLYTAFDHVRISLQFRNGSSDFNVISVGSLTLTQNSIPYVQPVSNEIFDMLYGNKQLSGEQNSILDFVVSSDQELQYYIDNIIDVLFLENFGDKVVTITDNYDVYINDIRPTVLTFGNFLSAFWDSLGTPLQTVIYTLALIGGAASLGGLAVNIFNRNNKNKGGKD